MRSRLLVLFLAAAILCGPASAAADNLTAVRLFTFAHHEITPNLKLATTVVAPAITQDARLWLIEAGVAVSGPGWQVDLMVGGFINHEFAPAVDLWLTLDLVGNLATFTILEYIGKVGGAGKFYLYQDVVWSEPWLKTFQFGVETENLIDFDDPDFATDLSVGAQFAWLPFTTERGVVKLVFIYQPHLTLTSGDPTFGGHQFWVRVVAGL